MAACVPKHATMYTANQASIDGQQFKNQPPDPKVALDWTGQRDTL